MYTAVSIMKGEACHKTYRKISDIWEVTVGITTNNITRVASLNENNPSVQMEFSSRSQRMPLYITNYQSEHMVSPMNIINIDNEIYPVQASALNFPMKGEVGEFQLSTRRNTETVDPDIMKCQVDNCELACESREPS